MTRYAQWCAVSHRHSLSESETGGWVRWADHEAEITRREAIHADLLAALKALRIDANRLCDRMLWGFARGDCLRAIAVADVAIAKAEGRTA